MKKRKPKHRDRRSRRKRKATRSDRLRQTLFQITGWKFAKCFAQPEQCPRPAIHAHSVQNARAIDLLVRSGHVVSIKKRMDEKKGVIMSFGPLGRNLATTFAGLCAEHDQAIFAPLDRQPFDVQNPEHLFLAAYRATFREIHAAIAAGTMLQTGYRARIALGFDRRGGPTPAGMKATEQMILAYETYEHKLEFDAAYLDRDFDRLAHDVVELRVAQPTVAACALFSLHDAVTRKRDWVRACLNILPVSQTKTVAVFSYLSEEATVARAVLSSILDSKGDFQKYELSRRLLNSCENWVIAPQYFQTWTPEKRRHVLLFYAATIEREGLTIQHPDLMLF